MPEEDSGGTTNSAPKERRIRRSRSRRHVPVPISHADQGQFVVANLLMPVTTRLQPSTYAALKRAGLEQKLYGRSPETVQEIAEEAFQMWLRENGYLT